MTVREIVLGADIGGTSTRVGVATVAGEVLALAVGGPGNPNTVGLEASSAQIRSVAAEALEGVPGRVVAAVVGLAGGSRTSADPGFLRAAVPARVSVPAVLVSDLAVAFCSATPAPSGTVVVAGTGAVAGHVRDGELVQQRDGWGWLLGDEGSGFWLGRAAVRGTLDALQRGDALGPLQADVLRLAGVAGAGSDAYLVLLQACYLAPPTWLAQFAVLVSRHAEQDPVAAAIADAAVGLLLRLLDGIDPSPGEPIVLAGSVLAQNGPVSRSFRRGLSRHPDVSSGETPVLLASSGVVGALWLALGSRSRDSSTHARLSLTARRWLGEA